MTYEAVKAAVKTALSIASGIPESRILWGHTSDANGWVEFPRVKIQPSGTETRGVPFTRYEWEPAGAGGGDGYMKEILYSFVALRISVQYEGERADGGEALLTPADRIAKVLRSPRVIDVLTEAHVSVESVAPSGPFKLEWGERELDASIAEVTLLTNLPLDLTPEGGADWFNRVEFYGTVSGDGAEELVEGSQEAP